MLFMLKDSFLKYLQFEKNYSDKTIVSYGIDLEKFEEYFKTVDECLDFTVVDADLIVDGSLIDGRRYTLLR